MLQHPCRRLPAAFTLVELLVVISIVGLLLAILLPTLSMVRQSGGATQCLANLREQGKMIALHAVESDGHAPLAGVLRLDASSTTFAAAVGDPERRRYGYVTSVLFPDWDHSLLPFPVRLAEVADPAMADSANTFEISVRIERGAFDTTLAPFGCPAQPVEARLACDPLHSQWRLELYSLAPIADRLRLERVRFRLRLRVDQAAPREPGSPR